MRWWRLAVGGQNRPRVERAVAAPFHAVPVASLPFRYTRRGARDRPPRREPPVPSVRLPAVGSVALSSDPESSRLESTPLSARTNSSIQLGNSSIQLGNSSRQPGGWVISSPHVHGDGARAPALLTHSRRAADSPSLPVVLVLVGGGGW
jgi:hypothetical protein